MLDEGCPNNWNFQNAFYFVGTVITTIGYGNMYPQTMKGKVWRITLVATGRPWP